MKGSGILNSLYNGIDVNILINTLYGAKEESKVKKISLQMAVKCHYFKLT